MQIMLKRLLTMEAAPQLMDMRTDEGIVAVVDNSPPKTVVKACHLDKSTATEICIAGQDNERALKQTTHAW